MKFSRLCRHPLISGTLILTIAGLLTRFLGFFYRIYLSQLIGAEGMGVYQLIGPISGICFALCCGPIQTSISRFVAASAAGQKEEVRNTYYGGLLISEFLACLTALFVYFNAEWLAVHILNESRCIILLKLLALSLPANAAGAAIKGYYYGRKRTEIPALSQLSEQVFRVLLVYLLTGYLLSHQGQIPISIAGIGLLAGELAGFLVCFSAIQIHWWRENRGKKSCPPLSPAPAMRKIGLMAAPLTANRLILGFLQSTEAIQIPERLLQYGLSYAAALSEYGILSGMALPFIFFPSALTGSLAVMLLPKVAESESTGNHQELMRTAELSVAYSLYIGILFTGIFITYGKSMGIIFFQSEEAGSYIRILGWLCPFLYLSTMTGSILNGLGRTATTFRQNLAGLGLRLLFVIFLIPRMGITAYLLGMLASELLVAALHILAMRKDVPFPFFAFYRLLRPMAAISLTLWADEQLSPVSGIQGLFLHCGLIMILYLLILYITKKEMR